MTNCQSSTGESIPAIGALLERAVGRRAVDHAREQAKVDASCALGKSWAVEALLLFGVPKDASAAAVKALGGRVGVAECLGMLSGYRLGMLRGGPKIVGLMVVGARRLFTRRLRDQDFSAVAAFKLYWPASTAARVAAQSILGRR
jgi:hypothetical protein